MARPIPNNELRSVKHEDKDDSPKGSQSILDLTIDSIKSNTSKNLIVGTASGWATGVAVVRVGRVAAFGLGGGIILLHFACECGYLHVNWERVKQAAGESQACLEKLLRFVNRNSCFSVGFFGGFFFGVAST
ncbi:FUN14 domain-containing protein 2-like [Helicoverpa zea]|uniref:FUN14 domain-containing protein 2-like n=1 Tax=Helicoverpa zea TaxID=7113 RepID=UPI000B3A964E|nr:FUN14 domain-containing protein 2-like [Helicoverpa zea]PZC79328.1 hypothetical protein B5X24_HaOG216477 [Helicoverpa armigera]